MGMTLTLVLLEIGFRGNVGGAIYQIDDWPDYVAITRDVVKFQQKFRLQSIQFQFDNQ